MDRPTAAPPSVLDVTTALGVSVVSFHVSDENDVRIGEVSNCTGSSSAPQESHSCEKGDSGARQGDMAGVLANRGDDRKFGRGSNGDGDVGDISGDTLVIFRCGATVKNRVVPCAGVEARVDTGVTERGAGDGTPFLRLMPDWWAARVHLGAFY